MPQSHSISAALSIAGSDSGGAAGIQADLLSFAANGVYGTTAITCLTAQNPNGVSAIEAAPAPFVSAQIEQVLAYYPVKAIKTGMLFNKGIIQAVSDRLSRFSQIPLIVDPVSVATSGAVLLDPSALEILKLALLPLATLITPNLDEASLLLNRPINTPAAMDQAATELANRYQATILLKGGHLKSDDIIDVAASPSGELQHFKRRRIQYIDTHGSGCTLSAAITAHLSLGLPMREAIERGLKYLQLCMESPLHLPQSPFINHLP